MQAADHAAEAKRLQQLTSELDCAKAAVSEEMGQAADSSNEAAQLRQSAEALQVPLQDFAPGVKQQLSKLLAM